MDKKKTLPKDLLILTIVSLVVSIVTILPELSIFFDDNEMFAQIYQGSIFNVISEGIVSFIIMIILFITNSAIFRFNDPTKKIGILKMVLSFLFLYIGSSLLRAVSEEIIFMGYTI